MVKRTNQFVVGSGSSFEEHRDRGVCINNCTLALLHDARDASLSRMNESTRIYINAYDLFSELHMQGQIFDKLIDIPYVLVERSRYSMLRMGGE